MSLKVWPIANFFTFTFVPIPYQVLFNNFVGVFFNAYLSYIHNDYEDKQKASIGSVSEFD